MTVKCVVCGGYARRRLGVAAVFSFPAQPDRKNRWLRACGYDATELPPNAGVCSQHFTPEDFSNSTSQRLRLNHSAVPSVQLMQPEERHQVQATARPEPSTTPENVLQSPIDLPPARNSHGSVTDAIGRTEDEIQCKNGTSRTAVLSAALDDSSADRSQISTGNRRVHRRKISGAGDEHKCTEDSSSFRSISSSFLGVNTQAVKTQDLLCQDKAYMMEDARLADKSRYKTCFVPNCTSSVSKTPRKQFFNVPVNLEIRRSWAKAARRTDAQDLTSRSMWFCCQDHFTMEDFSNYLKVQLMGGRLTLSKGVIPSIFKCQRQGQQRNSAERRQRQSLDADVMQVNGARVSATIACAGDAPKTFGPPADGNCCGNDIAFARNEITKSTPAGMNEEDDVCRDRAPAAIQSARSLPQSAASPQSQEVRTVKKSARSLPQPTPQAWESTGACTGARLKMGPMKLRAAFRHLRDLRAHLISEHGMVAAAQVVRDQFPSMEAFEVWLAAYSQYQGVQYVSTASEPDFGMHPSGKSVRHYQCLQVGSPPFFHCIEEACLSNIRLLGQKVPCTSEIVATVQEDASVTAVVHSFHYGHSINERTPTTLVHEADEEDQGSAPAELNTDSAADRDDTEEDDRAALEMIARESLQTTEFPDAAGRVVEIIVVTVPTVDSSEAEEDDRDECDAEAASESGSTAESLMEVTDSQEAPAELILPHEASDFTEPNADHLTALSTTQLAQTIVNKLSVVTERVRSAQQRFAQSRDVLLRLHSQVEQLQQTLEHRPSVTSAETRETITGTEGTEISPVNLHALYCIVNDHTYGPLATAYYVHGR